MQGKRTFANMEGNFYKGSNLRLKLLCLSASWRICRLKSRRWNSCSSPKVWTPCGEKTSPSGSFTTRTRPTMKPTGRTWGRRSQRARWESEWANGLSLHGANKVMVLFLQSITFEEFKAFCLFTNNLEDFSFSMKLVTGANRPVGLGESSAGGKVATIKKHGIIHSQKKTTFFHFIRSPV